LFNPLKKLWAPEPKPGSFGPGYGQLLCAVDDYRRFPLPEYVKRMGRSERRRWMSDNNVVPAISGAAYSMFEMMQPWMVADAVAVTTPASKTALTNDLIFTLPANIFSFPGKALWFHAVGVLTTSSTPGTYVISLNWHGSAGTVLAATSPVTPAAVTNTNTLWYCDFYLKARATGALTTSLTLTAYGSFWSPTLIVPTTQALYGANFAPSNIATPGVALADVTGLDQTIAQALTLSATPTVTTGSMACRDAWVVALN
jgi:hypothetical protein